MYRPGFGAILLTVLLLVPAGCSSNYRVSENAPIVRVRILENQEQVLVAASAAPVLTSSGDKTSRQLNFPGGDGVPVTLSPGGWRIGNVTIAGGELTIQPPSVGSVRVNRQAYRGRYRFVPVSGSRFDVINDVDVDSYLMSVVSRELLPKWQLEAYKAQAVAARTYALYEARTSGTGHAYDLQDDERSQVYGGLSAETTISRRAVAETSGVVVAWGPKGQEKIFKAYFSSCCGGVGQSAYEAFGDAYIPPLRAKNVGSLCNAAPRFNWGPIVLSKQEITRRIRAWGVRRNRAEKDMGAVVRIDIAPGAATSSRPVRFLVTDDRRMQYSMDGEELRTACNTDAGTGPKLFSSFFKPVNNPDAIQFVEGHGFGHGVGMCQWCTEARAEKGQRYEEIVPASYPGSVLVRAY